MVSSLSALVFRRSLMWGAAWAVTVTVVEFLTFSTIDRWGSGSQILFWLADWVLPVWCLSGYFFIRLAHVGERPGGRLLSLIGFVAVCVVASAALPPIATFLHFAAQDLLPNFARYALETGTMLPARSNWTTMGLYWLWVNFFYGGLLMTACTLVLRSERMRRQLHQTAMAHSRTESLLDAERLRTLQSQIDPSLLLDSMQELEQRYRADPERAERLLESLVEFLRFAMHGLRVPVSTIDAELKLARAYAQLQRERGMENAWRIEGDGAADRPAFKFPSLLMLPLLALGGERSRPMLRIQNHNGRTVLSLHGFGVTLSAELRQQIMARLRALYGDRFELETPPFPANHLAIVLQPARESSH